MNNYNFDTIIPIGQSCNITFLLQNSKIKKETTLFEWFVSNRLNNITDVLIKILNNNDNDIIKKNNNHIYINNENIFSGHYNLENFKEIYERRKNRLIESIKNNNKILFVRFEGSHNVYNHKDIDDFIDIIKIINPNYNKMKLLLITPNQIKLEHPFLITEFYNKHSEDPYCEGDEINNLFINILKKLEYNLNNRYDNSFNDMSIN
jgi:hypothetical protein